MTFYQQQVLSIRKAVYPNEDHTKKIIQARRFIDAHYSSELDLDRIAREACISKFHFIRLFRKYYGRTPHTYLKEVRLAAAKRLLQKGIPIRHVCYAVGFESVPSFTRLFKSTTGNTPGTAGKKAIPDKKVSAGHPIFIKKIL
jgi:AraC-like DNA-binding protein